LKYWILNRWIPYYGDSGHKDFAVITEPELFSEIRDTFNGHSELSEKDVVDKYAKTTFLVVDDLGKYSVGEPSFLQRIWFSIIDERYCHHRITVVTTNRNGAELQEHLGVYTFDRLRGMAQSKITKIVGESKR
jgi:DNA replication protein DnaC